MLAIYERGERILTHLWETKNLTKIFGKKSFFGKPKNIVKAVQDVSLYQNEGETLGIVGESGCGKSTFGRTLMGLYPKSSGEIYFRGEKLQGTKGMNTLRSHMQMVFQDPYASLNPRMKVAQIIEEPLIISGGYTQKERTEKVQAALNLVGLRTEHGQRYPHEFSGGQRQRIGIARAIITDPACIICDEPISALDVSIQVQIVTLLEKLQEEKNISYVFISHDLYMVRYLSQRIAVMYLGMVVEEGAANEIYDEPMHPYTKGLIAAVGEVRPHAPIRVLLEGEPPSPLNPPPGCPFSTRCMKKIARCEVEKPELKEVNGRKVACFLY